MKRKMIRNLSLALIALVGFFSLVFSFEGRTNAASLTSNPDQDLKVDTVDGIKYAPDKHKKIVGMVVEATNQGEKVHSFSTPEKYEAYHQKVTEGLSSQSIGIMARPTYLYEHTSGHGYGRSLIAYPGTQVTSLSTAWDNRISAVSVAPGSWIRLYQNRYYGGRYLTLVGYPNKYFTTNLTSWGMSGTTSWNDQVSSYRVR